MGLIIVILLMTPLLSGEYILSGSPVLPPSQNTLLWPLLDLEAVLDLRPIKIDLLVCLKVELFGGKDLWYQNDYTDNPRWKRISFEQFLGKARKLFKH